MLKIKDKTSLKIFCFYNAIKYIYCKYEIYFIFSLTNLHITCYARLYELGIFTIGLEIKNFFQYCS